VAGAGDGTANVYCVTSSPKRMDLRAPRLRPLMALASVAAVDAAVEAGLDGVVLVPTWSTSMVAVTAFGC